MSFLTEAFQELRLTESEDFSLDKKGTKELKDFLDDDKEMDIVTVIDTDVENPDDVSNVHIGMTILGCDVCNSLHYVDTDSLVIDEEQGLANIGECCPYCFSTDGFKIVGTVAPYEDVTVEVANTDVDSVDVKVDGKDVEDEDKKQVNEDLGSWMAAKKYKKLKSKEHGFMKRNSSVNGRKVLKRRRIKGRARLAI
jgi:large subunit ribosomal protein L34